MICCLCFAQAANMDALMQNFALAQEAARQAREEADEFRAKAIFFESLTNINPDLVFRVFNVRKLSPSADLQFRFQQFIEGLRRQDLTVRELATRYVFHTCPPDVIEDIGRDGLRPALCGLCPDGPVHDQGWFGNHTKTVYVSKHADYTFFYQRGRPPINGDAGIVLVFQFVTGRIRHLNQRHDGGAPDPRYFQLNTIFYIFVFCPCIPEQASY